MLIVIKKFDYEIDLKLAFLWLRHATEAEL